MVTCQGHGILTHIKKFKNHFWHALCSDIGANWLGSAFRISAFLVLNTLTVTTPRLRKSRPLIFLRQRGQMWTNFHIFMLSSELRRNLELKLPPSLKSSGALPSKSKWSTMQLYQWSPDGACAWRKIITPTCSLGLQVFTARRKIR